MSNYEELYENFQNSLRKNNFSDENIELIDKAYRLAETAHKE